jgi:hypothetical protein
MDCLHPNGFSAPRLVSWRRDHRNTRLGFATVELWTASGLLQISDIVVSQSHGSRFIAMPAGAYVAGGQAKYKTVLKWQDIGPFREGVIALIEQRDPEVFESGEPDLVESGDREWP